MQQFFSLFCSSEFICMGLVGLPAWWCVRTKCSWGSQGYLVVRRSCYRTMPDISASTRDSIVHCHLGGCGGFFHWILQVLHWVWHTHRRIKYECIVAFVITEFVLIPVDVSFPIKHVCCSLQHLMSFVFSSGWEPAMLINTLVGNREVTLGHMMFLTWIYLVVSLTSTTAQVWEKCLLLDFSWF